MNDDSPTGKFKPIGTFTIQNIFLAETPFQVVNFPAETARHVKITLMGSNAYAFEMQLMGKLE